MTLNFVHYKFTEWRCSIISTSDGILLYYLWVKCPQIRSWKDYTSQNYRILFNFRLCWLCMIKKRREARSRTINIQDSWKLHFHLMMWTRNFRVRNDVVEKGTVTKSQTGKEAYVEMKVGECFQWNAHGQCSRGDSCSFSHDPRALGNKGKSQRQKDDRLLLHPTRRQNRLTAKDKNPKCQAINKKALWKREKFHAYSKSAKNPSCKLWHPPICLNYISEKRCVHGDKCNVRHVEAEKKPGKKLRKSGAIRSIAMLKESIQLGCVSQASYPRKFYVNQENWDQSTPRASGTK